MGVTPLAIGVPPPSVCIASHPSCEAPERFGWQRRERGEKWWQWRRVFFLSKGRWKPKLWSNASCASSQSRSTVTSPLNLLTTNLRYPTFRVVQSATAAVLKREKNPAKPQKNPPLLYYIPHFFIFFLTYMWCAVGNCDRNATEKPLRAFVAWLA